jgi:ferric-dicitrate binding protein FerR (iron transport regulator)
MKQSGDELVMRADIAVEALLEKAAPRLAPPTMDEKIVRDAVRAEWQAVTSKHRARRRMTGMAIAATVVLAVAATFNALLVTDVVPEQVATISKSHGSIYLLGEQSELREIVDFSSISAGQTIVTGSDSGIGLVWGNGGSLRIDQDTRIEFTSADAAYLRSGRIYFDSTPSALVTGITGSGGEISNFRIDTAHGTVTHLGTQYMAFADVNRLSVSVREGQIVIHGTYYDETAEEGKQITVQGNARPSVVDMQRYGEAWEWIEATAPTASVDGRTVHEFLRWVGRETGLEIDYASPAAEETARNGILRGTVDQRPTYALHLRMLGEDLDWVIEEGVIKVSTMDSASGR